MIRVDSHFYTGMPYLIYFGFKYKVSAVGKCKSIAVTMSLFCISVAEDHKWIMVMAGGTADTSYRPVSMTQMCSFHLTLHVMFSIKMNRVQFSVFIVHLHGHCFFYCNRCGTCIFQAYSSCDHIKLWKYTIKKMSTQSAGMVFQNDFQSFCLIFLCKHCRKSFETVFSF